MLACTSSQLDGTDSGRQPRDGRENADGEDSMFVAGSNQRVALPFQWLHGELGAPLFSCLVNKGALGSVHLAKQAKPSAVGAINPLNRRLRDRLFSFPIELTCGRGLSREQTSSIEDREDLPFSFFSIISANPWPQEIDTQQADAMEKWGGRHETSKLAPNKHSPPKPTRRVR